MSDGATTVLKIERKDVEVHNDSCCCFLQSVFFFLSRERLTAVCQLRHQSPHYHHGVMRQIALGALHSVQPSVTIWVELWWWWGGCSKMARQLAITVRNRQETFNQLVWRRHDGTSRAPTRQARLRHRSEMLSLHLWWHAKKPPSSG